MRIDPSSPLPKYYQLRELLRSQIEAGVWKPGDMIPPERELCSTFEISRMTVRQALNDLVSEGLLVREQGRGTYVAQPKVQQALIRLTGFSDEMADRGYTPSSQVLRLELEEPRPSVCQALRLTQGRTAVILERLRTANAEAITLEVAWLHFPGDEALLAEDFSRQSLYNLLNTKYGIVPTRAEQYIGAAVGRRREQQLLHFHKGAPVLLARRITYDQNDHPFEYVESVYRADRYTFYTELNGDGLSASRWQPVLAQTQQ